MKFNKTNVGNNPRTELHDLLGLTGSEISFNNLAPNTNVPFVHYHKENEEVYIILDGFGKAIINDEDVELNKGDVLRISPDSKRQFFAGNQGISYICIQTKVNSLEEYTSNDAVIL